MAVIYWLVLATVISVTCDLMTFEERLKKVDEVRLDNRSAICLTASRQLSAVT